MSNKPQIDFVAKRSQIYVDLHKLTTKENRTFLAAKYVGKRITSAFRFFSAIFVFSVVQFVRRKKANPVFSNKLLALLLFASCSVLGVDYPPAPAGSYVADLAGVIDADYELKINELCQEVEDSTTAEMVVLTINSFEGEDPYFYATEIGNLWEVGEASEDNGVVMVVAVGDREVFTAAGYGMEAMLPDVRLAQIYRSILAPRFKKEKYGEGIYEALQLYAKEIQSHYAIRFEATRGAPTLREGWKRFLPKALPWICPAVMLIIFIGLMVLVFTTKGGTSGSGRSSSFWTGTSSSTSSWSGSSSSSSFNSGGFGGGSFGGGGAGGGW